MDWSSNTWLTTAITRRGYGLTSRGQVRAFLPPFRSQHLDGPAGRVSRWVKTVARISLTFFESSPLLELLELVNCEVLSCSRSCTLPSRLLLGFVDRGLEHFDPLALSSKRKVFLRGATNFSLRRAYDVLDGSTGIGVNSSDNPETISSRGSINTGVTASGEVLSESATLVCTSEGGVLSRFLAPV